MSHFFASKSSVKQFLESKWHSSSTCPIVRSIVIGKWHLGNSKKKYLPTRKGFDSFLGTSGLGINHITKQVKKYYFIVNIVSYVF
jgi:hypothetical protein